MDLRGRTAVVTGGLSGIGQAAAGMLTEAGVHVVTWDQSGSPDVVCDVADPGRLGEPVDVAQAIVAVLAFDWVTGQVLLADGGLSLHSPIDFYGSGLRRAGLSGPR